MVNTRQKLKSYMGFTITKINECRYHGFDGKTQFESNELDSLKKMIRGYAGRPNA